MKQITIYLLDSTEGDTVEEKAYNVMAEGFDEVGYDSTDFGSNLDMVETLYRVASARQITQEQGMVLTGLPVEWEVTIEGEDDDIDEYEDVLEELE